MHTSDCVSVSWASVFILYVTPLASYLCNRFIYSQHEAKFRSIMWHTYTQPYSLVGERQGEQGGRMRPHTHTMFYSTCKTLPWTMSYEMTPTSNNCRCWFNFFSYSDFNVSTCRHYWPTQTTHIRHMTHYNIVCKKKKKTFWRRVVSTNQSPRPRGKTQCLLRHT